MLINSQNDEFKLTERIETALSKRLSASANYTAIEQNKINELNHRLVPESDVEIDEKTGERLRALAKLSQTELKPPRAISSHRPLLGPIIVKAKRALWPLLNALLKDTFRAQKEFNELLLEEYLHSIGRK